MGHHKQWGTINNLLLLLKQNQLKPTQDPVFLHANGKAFLQPTAWAKLACVGIQFTVAIKAACEALKQKGYGDSRPYQIPNTDATILIGSSGNSGNGLLKLRFVQKRLTFVQLIEVKIKIKTEIKGLVLKCSIDLFLINNPTCVSDDKKNFF